MTGEYLPGPPSTGADYWVGDTVTLDTGATAWDLHDRRVIVRAITVSRNDDNGELVAVPELLAGDEVGS